VILYEEDPTNPNGKRFTGTAVWRTEAITRRGAGPAEIVIRADVEVPERNLAMTWLLRRNANTALPATHIIEITFTVPPDFQGGGISEVPGMLMKAAEQTRGVPLAGLSYKITPGFYQIALSAAEADKNRNLQLLKERAWIDVPVVYSDGRRAIIALEKGKQGIQALNEAFVAWEQNQNKPRSSIAENRPKAPGPTSSGSGFFLTKVGHVVTNSHVVQGCTKISVKLPGDTAASAVVLARDEHDDLVVLKANRLVETAATVRSSPSPRSGEAIAVFGFPLSGILASTGNATTGNVTALAGLRDDPRHLQISAPVQPGNSGGPVLDMSGNVVGVVVSKLDALKMARLSDDVPQNINFAIKASTLTNFLEARGIAYTSGQRGPEVSIPDIVDKAKAFSVQVQCEQ
jgi:S1-C subfamily serine protease